MTSRSARYSCAAIVRGRSPVIAASMAGLFVLLWTPGTIFSVLNGNFTDNIAESLSLSAAFTAFMAVGAIVVARRPGNAIGWIFSAIGLLAATGVVAQEYAEYGYVTRPGSLPAPVLAAWYANWYWFPLIGLMMLFTLLLFPTGRLLSSRWRPIAWLAAGSTITVTVLAFFNPTLRLQNEDYSVNNPIAVEAIGNVEETMVGNVLFALVLFCQVAALSSLIVRLRRSRGDERQQLKWFSYAGALIVLGAFSDFIPLPLDAWGDVVFGLIVAFLPVSAGIAILKYRLYDIDVIINRTLVYGFLTAVLGLGYLGLVVLFQEVLPPLTRESDVAIAGSTLAVAALFRPARARIQAFIDRRFYRRKYDAARTLERFGARLRDEVDLDALGQELLTAVNETMQPVQVSLWLTSPTAGARADRGAEARS